jgi:glyoxylase-like metal-dependent hydrolase (beta-lactamase superfamily II)/rhodanese-related sulfurtransferase
MQEVDTNELLALRREKPCLILLDCRGPDYWRWERIPNSANLRWKYIKDRASKVFPDLTSLIVTYCDGITCPASTKAYQALVELGYKNVFEYPGGISEWKAHGRATEFDKECKIAGNVYAFPKQYFYDSPVFTYLVEEEDCIILIDGPQQLTEEHEDFILNFGKPIKIILTHAPTGASVNELRSRLQAQIFLHRAEENDEWRKFEPDIWLSGQEKFGNLKIIHTPGHSAGSLSIYDSQNKILFTGDHLGGTPSGEIDDVRKDSHARGKLSDRFISISKLLDIDFEIILPFHYYQIRTEARNRLDKFFRESKHE